MRIHLQGANPALSENGVGRKSLSQWLICISAGGRSRYQVSACNSWNPSMQLYYLEDRWDFGQRYCQALGSLQRAYSLHRAAFAPLSCLRLLHQPAIGIAVTLKSSCTITDFYPAKIPSWVTQETLISII